MHSETVGALARALGVEVERIMGDQPDPPPQIVRMSLEQFHDRELALEAARRKGLDPEAIALVAAGSHDLPTGAHFDEWIGAIEAAAAKLRRARLGQPARPAKEQEAHQALMDERAREGAPNLPWRK